MSKDKDSDPRQEEIRQNERRRRQAEELIAKALEERRRFRLAQALKDANLPQDGAPRDLSEGNASPGRLAEGEWTFALDTDD
jgi:hypothetical protein